MASGCMNSTTGKATAKLMPHFFRVSTVRTPPRPLATVLLMAQTNPVIGQTSRKLWIYRL